MEDLGVIKLDELRAMRDEMSQLSRLLRDHFEGPSLPATGRKLDVRIQVVESERKPVVIEIRGVISFTARLSYVRASLLVALLVDLRDRCDGGCGVTELHDAAAEIWATLDPNGIAEAKAAGCLRVAMYRIGDFFAGIAPSVHGLSLALDLKSGQLVAKASDGTPIETLEIDITSSDVRVLDTLLRIADVSPLNLIKRRKAVFFPMDAAAIDRLHLAFFRSASPMRVRSSSFRLTSWLHPQNLLERTVATSELRELAQLVHQRLQDGSVTLTEIVHRESLWDSIRESGKGKFQALARGTRVPDVLEYLDGLTKLCRSGQGYQLILTETELPFFVVTYELDACGGRECYTLLFRSPMRGEEVACSCFAVHGDQFFERVSEQVVDWALQRADSLIDCPTVVQEIDRVREQLATHGPLRGSEPDPTLRAPADATQRIERLGFAPGRSWRSSPSR